tara:strand:+ start:3775 stop:4332 length:558 start_codon:yes stop_codon:yes gene_type:complete
MPNISNFRAQLGDGGARPNQFVIKINWPSVCPSGLNLDSNTSLLVTGAAAPASTVNPAIIQYRGREVKFAGERIFDPWTITVVNPNNFGMRAAFEEWMEAMNNKDSNEGVLALADYSAQIFIQHLDRNDEPICEWELNGAFPINMSEIALQYAQNDILEEYTVTFQYQDYTGGQGKGSVTTSLTV